MRRVQRSEESDPLTRDPAMRITPSGAERVNEVPTRQQATPTVRDYRDATTGRGGALRIREQRLEVRHDIAQFCERPATLDRVLVAFLGVGEHRIAKRGQSIKPRGSRNLWRELRAVRIDQVPERFKGA